MRASRFKKFLEMISRQPSLPLEVALDNHYALLTEVADVGHTRKLVALL
jgi:hypothetical protein